MAEGGSAQSPEAGELEEELEIHPPAELEQVPSESLVELEPGWTLVDQVGQKAERD